MIRWAKRKIAARQSTFDHEVPGRQPCHANFIGNKDATNVAPAEWFSLSPNPSQGWLDVSFKKDLQEEETSPSLRVLNLQGQTVYANRAPGSEKAKLQLDGLAPGLYVVVLELQGQILQREKLVIE